jgi:maleamate amidohydrolase
MLTSTVEWNELHHVWDDIVDEPMRTIYSAYERPLGVGARPAVIAIDLYNKVFAGGVLPPHELQAEHPSSCGLYAHAAVPHIVQVFETARLLGIPILHLTASRSGSRAVATNRKRSRLMDSGSDFYEPVAPAEGEPVIEKERASSFYGTQLVAELVMRDVDTLIVVGESTSGCVRASVVDGYSNGFHVVVVENGVFDRSWLNHQVNLFDLHHKYADVIDAEHVTGLMRAVAAPTTETTAISA